MNIDGSIQFGKSNCAVLPSNNRSAFTLIEILVVVAIVGVLMAALGGVLANTARKAREAATIATIQKVDGLIQDRIKGFERYTKSRNFQQLVDFQKTVWDSTNSIPSPGVSRKFAEAATRKELFRISFPQSFSDPVDLSGTTAIAKIIADPTTKPYNTSGTHKPETESAALLYYVVSRMQVFGIAPVAESDFSTSEVADTDKDGLLEFVDGWGRPLRFYRWPTRLLKPNGIAGLDDRYGAASVDDDGNGTVDDIFELGWLSTDDVVVTSPVTPTAKEIRSVAGLLVDGLPRVPVISGQWDPLSEDPDDPYGRVSTEIKRLAAPPIGINLTIFAAAPVKRYMESLYPTLDTYHTPLILSVGPDNDSGLFEPYQGVDTNGDGVFDSDLGILAQPKHGAAPYDIGADVFSSMSDNITNRNRRAGKGK